MAWKLFVGQFHVDFEWSHLHSDVITVFVDDFFLLVDNVDLGVRKLLHVLVAG